MKAQTKRNRSAPWQRAGTEAAAKASRERQAAALVLERRSRLHAAVDAVVVALREKEETPSLAMLNAQARVGASTYTTDAYLAMLAGPKGLAVRLVELASDDALERAEHIGANPMSEDGWYATASAGIAKIIADALALIGAELASIHDKINDSLTPVAHEKEASK